MSKEYDTLAWYKDSIKRMSWDEIQELMEEKIKNGSWDKFVETLGKPPHVIKHDHFIEQMNKQVDSDDVAKALGHMDEDGKFITGEDETEYVNTGHGIPL